jgi:hypothetical protein
MEDYLRMIRKMSNEDLLQELVDINAYSPEDITPSDVVDEMDRLVRKEIIDRIQGISYNEIL